MNEEKPIIKVIIDVADDAGGIWPILCMAPHTLQTIAPERADDLRIQLGAGITIHLTDDDSFRACASTDSRTITLTRGFAECLWCASYAYNAFYLELTSQSKRDTSLPQRLELSPKDSPEIELAARTLKTAMIAAGQGSALLWYDLPRPVKPQEVTRERSLIVTAGEMTLCSLGFILHHELAHIQLGHQGHVDTQWTLDQEKEADGEAIQWILGKAPEMSEIMVAKRLWGIGIATIFSIAISLTKRSDKAQTSNTHPQPYERLDKAMQHEAIQRNDALRETMAAIACAALVPHIKIAGLKLKDGPFENWSQVYYESLNVLSEALVNL